MSVPAFLFLSVTFVLAHSTDPVTYLLVETRKPPEQFFIANHVVLECRDDRDQLQPNTVFFRDNKVISLPNSVPLSGMATFIITPALEGNYTCGVSLDNILTSLPRTLVARPDSNRRPGNVRDFYSVSGSTARLDCSIPPGTLSSQYYVTWRSATNQTVYYETESPYLNRPDSKLSDRYSIDRDTLSLYIKDVGLQDTLDGYQCILSVEDPLIESFPFTFTNTESVNLSLFIYEAPVFVEEPKSIVVISGTEVSFNCTVLSSPRASFINWKLGGSIVDRSRFTNSVVPNPEGGMLTRSVLTLHNVTGFDSNTVECSSKYYVDPSLVLATIRKEVVLSVLDEIETINPIQLQEGGFVFVVTLKAPLLTPLRLSIVYTEDGSGLEKPMKSSVFYFNTSVINHVAFREQVPYDHFRVMIGLVYKDIDGPLYGTDNVYNRAGIGIFTIAFWVLLSVLLLIVFLIIVLIIITAIRLSKKKQGLQKVLRGYSTQIFNQVIKINFTCGDFRNCQCCCSSKTKADSEQSAFDKNSAKEYVSTIEQAIAFGKDDPVLRDLLKKYPGSDAEGSLRSPSTGKLIDELETAVPYPDTNGDVPVAASEL